MISEMTAVTPAIHLKIFTRKPESPAVAGGASLFFFDLAIRKVQLFAGSGSGSTRFSSRIPPVRKIYDLGRKSVEDASTASCWSEDRMKVFISWSAGGVRFWF